LRPDWLSVPAADREPRSARSSADDGASAGVGSAVACSEMDWDRRRGGVSGDHDGLLMAGPGIPIRLVIFAQDPWTRNTPLLGAPSSILMHFLPPSRSISPESFESAGAQVELIRLQTVYTTRLPSDQRSQGNDLIHRCGIDRLDKHQVDISLSAGRHAAERAKLAGIQLLIGMASSAGHDVHAVASTTDPVCGGLVPFGFSRSHPCPFGASQDQASLHVGRARMADPCHLDPYDGLRCLGQPAVAALAGAAIAGAQIGIPVCLPGPIGAVAALAAMRLNPGVRNWLEQDAEGLIAWADEVIPDAGYHADRFGPRCSQNLCRV
jgi:hypothetical protein